MIINATELPTIDLNTEEITKALFDGIWIGIKMWFDTPQKIMMWLAILALFILSLVIKKKTREKRMRKLAKYQAEEMIKAKNEYK